MAVGPVFNVFDAFFCHQFHGKSKPHGWGGLQLIFVLKSMAFKAKAGWGGAAAPLG